MDKMWKNGRLRILILTFSTLREWVWSRFKLQIEQLGARARDEG